MTVKELKKELKKYDESTDVAFCISNRVDYDISGIRLDFLGMRTIH